MVIGRPQIETAELARSADPQAHSTCDGPSERGPGTGVRQHLGDVTPPGKRQRLCAVVASFEGFRLRHANPIRQAVAQNIMRWAAAHDVATVVLPAGYIRARSVGHDDILRDTHPLLDTAAECDVGLVVGVDACSPDWEDLFPRDPFVAQGALPILR